MKTCSKCNLTKELDKFHKNGKFTYSVCKVCKKSYKHSHYIKNKARYSNQYKTWAKAHPERVKELYWKTRKKYKYKYVENCRRYFAKKLNATPKWLTKEQILEMKAVYKNCPKGYDVDHIVPLRGENVSGLHVPWNLQILPSKLNRSKSNKFVP